MGIKQYIFLSIIFIFVVSAGVYTIDGSTYTLNIFARSLTLPVAIWIIVPLILLFISTVLHLFYYRFRQYFEKRVIKKDYETLLLDIKSSVIYEEAQFEYKTEFFKNLSNIVKKLNYNPNSNSDKVEPTFLNDTFTLLKNIYSGEYSDIKKFKLRNDNPITIQNKSNILNADRKTFLDNFKNCKSLEDEFCKKAFDKFVDIATFTEIKKIGFVLSNENLIKIFKRYADEESFDITNEDIKNSLESSDFSCNEYLYIAKILKQKIDPSSLLAMFEQLQTTKTDATTAYLYILFELQMIDKAREILDNSEDSDHQKFKILLFLRDNGKNIDTDLIV